MNKKGSTIMLATFFMAVMFALCTLVLTYVISSYSRARASEKIYELEFAKMQELDQIGDDFLNAVQTATVNGAVELKNEYKDYDITITCYTNEAAYKSIIESYSDKIVGTAGSGKNNNIFDAFFDAVESFFNWISGTEKKEIVASAADKDALEAAIKSVFNLYVMEVKSKDGGDLLLNVSIKEEWSVSDTAVGATYTVLNWSDQAVSAVKLNADLQTGRYTAGDGTDPVDIVETGSDDNSWVGVLIFSAIVIALIALI